MASSVRRRAEDARDKVRALHERIGFDDDKMDDFKDDLKQLEKNARIAEMAKHLRRLTSSEIPV